MFNHNLINNNLLNYESTRINLMTYKHLFEALRKGKPKWKIAIYVRLSKEDKKRKDISESIYNQLKWIARQIVRMKLDNFEIVDIYIDDGLTGTDFDREDYIRMLTDINNKNVNCIMIKDITRYARNLADGIKELDSFVLDKKIRFICTHTPKFDTLSDPTAISSPTVYQALQDAESHARNTSVKVRDVQEMMRDEGIPTGGFPPYGFMKNPDEFETNWIIDPEAIAVVKQIFDWSTLGYGDRWIAKELNSRGIPNPTLYKQQKGLNYQNPHAANNSGLWWASTVNRILKNKVYLGYMIQGKSSSFDHKRHKQEVKPVEEHIVVADCHEQAIDDTIFQESADQKKQRTRSTKKGGTPHLFANLVCCSGCKRAMKKTNNGNYHYLRCRTEIELGKNLCDAKSKIPYKELEDTMIPLIQSQINLVAKLQETIKHINQNTKTINQSSRIEMMFKSTEEKRQQIDEFLDKCYYDFNRGILSEEQFLRIKADNEKRKDQLLETLRNLSALQSQVQMGIKSNNQYFEHFLKYQNMESLDRIMLTELVKRIEVKPDKSIDVVFNYADQYQLILDFIRENQNEPDEMVRKRKI